MDAKELKPGKYRHYKGNEYELGFVAQNSETLEKMVVYRALYGDKQWWVRPYDMFVENVVVNGKITPRFKYLGK